MTKAVGAGRSGAMAAADTRCAFAMSGGGAPSARVAPVEDAEAEMYWVVSRSTSVDATVVPFTLAATAGKQSAFRIEI